MKNTITLVLCFVTTIAFGATEAQEEAIILNQEIEFLQNSVKEIEKVSSDRAQTKGQSNTKGLSGLEKTYFGENTNEDAVNIKASGLKKRNF
jgi:hypothetical protein